MKDAKNAIDFANMGYKYQYDKLHQPLFLRINDLVLLCLYKGYTIPSKVRITTKLAQQFVGSFRVNQKNWSFSLQAENLTTLENPSGFHNCAVGTLCFRRPIRKKISLKTPKLSIKCKVKEELSVVNHLLNKRVVKKGKGLAIEYLVKWKGYGPEFDRWCNVKTLDEAKD